MSNLSLAGLLHIFGWIGENSKIQLEDGLSIEYSPSGDVITFYNKLCRENNIDDGDPFSYLVYILCEKKFGEWDLAFGTPFSTIDFVSNIIAINISQPIGMCRVIASKDDFKTLHFTTTIFQHGIQTDALFIDNYKITDEVKIDIANSYQNLKEKESKTGYLKKVRNALDYFYYAWRSPFLEQTNINLAISLESLFSPSSNSELAHQIAFNIAKFLGETPESQIKHYEQIKKFYSIRSKIVHGSAPGDDIIWDNTIESFHLTAIILRKILLDKNLIEIFNDNKKRIDYLRDGMFS